MHMAYHFEGGEKYEVETNKMPVIAEWRNTATGKGDDLLIYVRGKKTDYVLHEKGGDKVLWEESRHYPFYLLDIYFGEAFRLLIGNLHDVKIDPDDANHACVFVEDFNRHLLKWLSFMDIHAGEEGGFVNYDAEIVELEAEIKAEEEGKE